MRKYSGNQESIWDEVEGCEHEWEGEFRPTTKVGCQGMTETNKYLAIVNNSKPEASTFCSKCHAWKGALGLEPTPELYIKHLVDIFELVKRVLSPRGVVWLNIGDSYCGGGQGDYGINQKEKTNRGSRALMAFKTKAHSILKPLDLCLIPQRLAIALQEAGWYVRSIPIWFKPNPMPESVNGWRFENGKLRKGSWRPTDSYDWILMLTKSSDYYADGEDVRKAHIRLWDETNKGTLAGNSLYTLTTGNPTGHKRQAKASLPNPSGRNLRNVWEFSTEPFGMEMCTSCKKVYEAAQYRRLPEKAGSRKCKCAEHNKDYIPDWIPIMVEVESDDFVGNTIEEGQQCQLCGAIYTPAEFAQLPEARVKICRCGETEWLSHFACVDGETECLTSAGWKRHTELNIGDTIAAYNINKQQLRWSIVNDIAKYDVSNQLMVGLKHRSLDMLLTPNHRCIVSRRSGNQVIQIADKLTSTDSILVASDFENTSLTPVSDKLAELIGWYIAEGYECKGSNSIEIYQNEPKATRIRMLLNDLQADWKEAQYQKSYHKRLVNNICFRLQGYFAFRLRELCPQKQFPIGFLLWSNELKGSLIEGLIGGDGNTRLDGRRFFCQKDRKRIDDFQALATTLGYSSVLNPRAGNTFAVYLTNKKARVLHTARGSLLYHINYTGTVWCPSTAEGTFVARRNGKIFITGNTFPERLPEICILSSTSDKGNCPKCGMPWVRVIEKEASTMNIRVRDAKRGVAGAEEGYKASQKEIDEYGKEVLGHSETLGWLPSCQCEEQPVPAIVLDPFSGSGTVGAVAKRLGRKAILIDASEDYCKLAEARVAKVNLPLK